MPNKSKTSINSVEENSILPFSHVCQMLRETALTVRIAPQSKNYLNALSYLILLSNDERRVGYTIFNKIQLLATLTFYCSFDKVTNTKLQMFYL